MVLYSCRFTWSFGHHCFICILLAFWTVKENDQWLPCTVIVPEDSQKPPLGYPVWRNENSARNRRIFSLLSTLTLILLTWSIGWAPNNVSKWQMGFNLAFKGLILYIISTLLSSVDVKIVHFNLLRTGGYFMHLRVWFSKIPHAPHIAFMCFV
jgi:hypothetical protein